MHVSKKERKSILNSITLSRMHKINACTNLKRKNYLYLTKNLFSEIRNIKHSKIKLKFQSSKIKFKRPNYSQENSILKEKTYTIATYIPLTIKYGDKVLIK